MLAVNAAITLQRPLLVKGEPGTGKTMLAEEVAEALDMPLLQWHIKSTTKAQQGLYEYDAVSRLRDSQLGDERVKDIHNYIVKGVLWQAFTADARGAADRRDRQGRHRVPQRPAARTRPHGVLLLRDARDDPRQAPPAGLHHLEQRKELPDAFLRRCFFHYIKFPEADTMRQIVDVHFPTLKASC
jgi:MoxR-like ATPase